MSSVTTRTRLQPADFFPSKSLIAMFKSLVTTSNHLSQAVFCTFLPVVSGTYYKSDDSCSLHTYRRALFESHSLMQQRLIMIMLPLKCKSFFLLFIVVRPTAMHVGSTYLFNNDWQQCPTQRENFDLLRFIYIERKRTRIFPRPSLLFNMNITQDFL